MLLFRTNANIRMGSHRLIPPAYAHTKKGFKKFPLKELCVIFCRGCVCIDWSNLANNICSREKKFIALELETDKDLTPAPVYTAETRVGVWMKVWWHRPTSLAQYLCKYLTAKGIQLFLRWSVKPFPVFLTYIHTYIHKHITIYVKVVAQQELGMFVIVIPPYHCNT
jgi:hypothetical protein